MKKQKKGYSVKPGRATAAQGVIGGVFGMIFGVIWTVAAVSMGAPWFFGLFGIFFVVMIGVSTFVNYKNVTGDNRFSEYDIVDINDEPDPWDKKFRGGEEEYRLREDCGHVHMTGADCEGKTRFCPYCGTAAKQDFEFCKNCGKKLPD